MSDNDIRKKMRSAMFMITGSNYIGAIAFFVAWKIFPELWLLIPAILMVITGTAFIFIVNKLEKKYLNAQNGVKNDRK